MPAASIGDIRMYYELSGQGEPLVLITGLGNDVTQYEHIIRQLSRNNRVLAFDNRGAGRTDSPDTPYSMEQMADDTAALMDALDISQAHVAGVSMGGRIAMALALRHPEHARSLTLISTFARRNDGNGRMPRYTAGFSKYQQPRHAFDRQLIASRDYDCSGRLGEISVPALVMHGRYDTLVPIALAEEVHAGIKGSRMIAFDGGHLFFLSMHERLCDTMAEFLSGIDKF